MSEKNDTLLKSLKESTEQLLKQIKAFPQDKFNEKPASGDWSAADICEHISILEGLIYQVLIGATETLDDRPADQKVETIKSSFLNFNDKLEAGPVIQPTIHKKHKNDLIRLFKDFLKRCEKIISKDDLNLLCLDYDHAMFGYLTRLEWIHFIHYHRQRHMKQIRDLTDS